MDISEMTSEQIAKTPELAHLYDIVHFLEVTPEKDVFPKKYEAATISMAVQSAHNLLKDNPYMSLKDTVTQALNGCEDGLSSDVVLKITQKVIKKWEKIAKIVVSELRNELQAA
jgi:hypothetical protein